MSRQGSEMSKRPPPRVWRGGSPEPHSFHSPQSSRSGAGVGNIKPPGRRPCLPTPNPEPRDFKARGSACRREGCKSAGPLGAANIGGAPARSHQVSSAVWPDPPARRARPALLTAGGFHVDQGGKMTSLLTDRYTETWLVIYWLSAPDGSH